MRLQWVDVGAGRQRLVDLDFKGNADAPLTRRDTLTQKERRGLYLQTGKKFGTMSECRAYMKANDMRFIDRGDRQDRARKRMKEYMRDTKPGDRGRAPFLSKDSKRHGSV